MELNLVNCLLVFIAVCIFLDLFEGILRGFLYVILFVGFLISIPFIAAVWIWEFTKEQSQVFKADFKRGWQRGVEESLENKSKKG
jgi:hypothetical protein